MKFILKVFRFVRRSVAKVVYFFIRSSYDEFARKSACFQNVQDLQILISDAVNDISDAVNDIRGDILKLRDFSNYSARKMELYAKYKDLPEVDYVAFENKFRGEEGLIKDRQRSFLGFFGECKNVLDIGCGRGEFLELLKEEGVYATGVDVDGDMVSRCKDKGLNVIKADAFAFLDDLEADKIDGVFCSQVIEHFSFRDIQLFLHLLSKKIRKHGIILLETINPRCVPAMQHFYVDITHVQPVDYEALSFLLGNNGFRLNSSVLSSPIDLELAPTTRELNHENITRYGDYALVFNKI